MGFQLDDVLALSSMRIKLTSGPDDKDFKQPQKLLRALRVCARPSGLPPSSPLPLFIPQQHSLPYKSSNVPSWAIAKLMCWF